MYKLREKKVCTVHLLRRKTCKTYILKKSYYKDMGKGQEQMTEKLIKVEF